jgi:hypothetical protein
MTNIVRDAIMNNRSNKIRSGNKKYKGEAVKASPYGSRKKKELPPHLQEQQLH